MNNKESLLEKANDLPALPAIYVKASALLDDQNSTAEKIADIVQTDPVITSRILKIVNSAYYGLNQPVTSISQSVSLLGNQRLKQILLGVVLGGLFKNINTEHFSLEAFWQHTIKTAILARHLAMQNVRIIDHDALFTAGLLHNIGRLIIASAYPDKIAEIELLKQQKGIETAQAENEVLGFHHIDASGALLTKWKLPEILIHCAKNHNEINHEGPLAIPGSIIYLAHRLSRYEAPADEEEALILLSRIENWQQANCTVEQICTGWHMADLQLFEVMESFGMVDFD